MKPQNLINELEILVITALANLKVDYVCTKSYLSIQTKIPQPYLDAVLTDLRKQNFVEIDHMMNEGGMFQGSGYKLTYLGLSRDKFYKNLERKLEREKQKNDCKKWGFWKRLRFALLGW